MHCLGKRLILPELLDSLPEDQARASLRDLVRINRRWGGHSTLRSLLRDVLHKTVPDGPPFSVLDVGAASGDMGACIRQWYPAATVTSLDYLESHLTWLAGTASRRGCLSSAIPPWELRLRLLFAVSASFPG